MIHKVFLLWQLPNAAVLTLKRTNRGALGFHLWNIESTFPKAVFQAFYYFSFWCDHHFLRDSTELRVWSELRNNSTICLHWAPLGEIKVGVSTDTLHKSWKVWRFPHYRKPLTQWLYQVWIVSLPVCYPCSFISYLRYIIIHVSEYSSSTFHTMGGSRGPACPYQVQVQSYMCASSCCGNRWQGRRTSLPSWEVLGPKKDRNWLKRDQTASGMCFYFS